MTRFSSKVRRKPCGRLSLPPATALHQTRPTPAAGRLATWERCSGGQLCPTDPCSDTWYWWPQLKY